MKQNGGASTSQEVESEISKFRNALPQILAVGAKNLVLYGYGMTLGYPTILIPSLKAYPDRKATDEFTLNEEQLSWISSINLITVPLGCLLSGILTSPIGRRRSMQLVNIPFIVAWLLFYYSNQVKYLYIALAITGFSGGILEAPVLTYVAEITQPHLRGFLSSTSSFCIILGIFTEFLMGTFLTWRTMALCNISVPVAAIVSLFFIPESPYWLISKNKFDEAKTSLSWLRGWCSIEKIIPEFKHIYETVHKQEPEPIKHGIDNVAFDGKVVKINGDKTGGTLVECPEEPKFNIGDYFKRSFLLPYFLVCFSFFLGHFSGMTTLQTFAVDIFGTLKAPIDKYYATLILGLVELLGTLIAVVFVHYSGKRPLSLVSTIGCGICFILVATYAYLIENHMSDTSSIFKEFDFESYRWFPTTFLILSALLSHFGIRLLPWILIGEVFTNETRANAAGLASGMGYIFGFITNKIYFNLIDSLTMAGTFYLYGSISLCGTFVLYYILPETEGKPLSEIQDHFAGLSPLRNSVRRSQNENGKQPADVEASNRNSKILTSRL